MAIKRNDPSVKVALITVTGAVLVSLISTAATVYLAIRAKKSAENAQSSEETAKSSADEASRLAALLKVPTFFPKEFEIGEVPMTGNVSEGVRLKLPDVVPNDAKYVYVLATAKTGNTHGSREGFLVVTSESRFGTEKLYSYVFAFEQNAYSFTSNSAWMPVPSDRFLQAQYTPDTPLPADASATARVYILAYR